MQFFAMCIPTITSFAENGDMCIPEPLNVRPKVGGAKCVGSGYDCVYGKDGVDGTPSQGSLVCSQLRNIHAVSIQVAT